MTTKLVLFDLDGTLADTAPDIAIALNKLLVEEGYLPLPLEPIRATVSRGSAALLELALPMNCSKPYLRHLSRRMFRYYQESPCANTRLFPGVTQLLRDLTHRDIGWGVVTNKPLRPTLSILENLNLPSRPDCIIGGDSLKYAKPHPMPLQTAVRRFGCSVQETIYVGDAKIDVDAARQAKIPALIALFGYAPGAKEVAQWQPSGMLERPQDLLKWLNQADQSARAAYEQPDC